MALLRSLTIVFIIVFATANIQAQQPDSNFYCFLLFGQSNMAGGFSWRSGLIKADCDTNPRIKVLAFDNCSATGYNSCKADSLIHTKARTYDLWYTASPPLHDCGEGICPGDYFAKTLLDSLPPNVTIGLIPCALSGMALDVFQKGGSDKSTVGPSAVNGKNAYQWLIDRCTLAQKTGVIKGMLLHQGESGVGSGTTLAWDALAIQIFNNLKKDLGLDSVTPCVVGELRSDTVSPAPQYNAGTNKLIDGMATKYTHCAVASSKGLTGNGLDIWHFTSTGFREFGKRYAKGLLSVASPKFMPRKGSSNIISAQPVRYKDLASATGVVNIYSIDGRTMRSCCAPNTGSALRNLNARGLFIVSRKLTDGRTAILPYIHE